MKFDISKDWCTEKAKLEDGCEVGAGSLSTELPTDESALDLGVFEGHSPAPWRIDIHTGDSERLYQTDDWTIVSLDGKHVCYEGGSHDAAPVDARLLVSAPQLLAEVKRQRAQIAELEGTTALLQAEIDDLNIRNQAKAELVAELQKYKARYLYIRDNLTWHRHGNKSDPDSYSLVGCKFHYSADFQASVMLDHHIDSAMAAQEGEG